MMSRMTWGVARINKHSGERERECNVVCEESEWLGSTNWREFHGNETHSSWRIPLPNNNVTLYFFYLLLPTISLSPLFFFSLSTFSFFRSHQLISIPIFSFSWSHRFLFDPYSSPCLEIIVIIWFWFSRKLWSILFPGLSGSPAWLFVSESTDFVAFLLDKSLVSHIYCGRMSRGLDFTDMQWLW